MPRMIYSQRAAYRDRYSSFPNNSSAAAVRNVYLHDRQLTILFSREWEADHPPGLETSRRQQRMRGFAHSCHARPGVLPRVEAIIRCSSAVKRLERIERTGSACGGARKISPERRTGRGALRRSAIAIVRHSR
jgi:hypothetical protein